MLICRSSLLPGESLPSLVTRLAKLNRYHPSTILDRLCLADLPGNRVGHPTQSVVFERLAHLTRIDPLQLFRATRHYFTPILAAPDAAAEILTLPGGETMPMLPSRPARMQLRSDTVAQFCPHCLQEAAYHRLLWLPIAVAVCLKHRCLLIQACPECRQPLSIGEIVATQCRHCDADLKQAPTDCLDHDPIGLISQQFIQGWLNGSVTTSTPSPKLPDQPPAVLYQVVDGFRSSVMKASSDWEYLHRIDLTHSSCSEFGTFPGQMIPLASYICYATAFKGMMNWPHGFYEFLKAYRDRSYQYLGQGLHADLGYLYHTCLEKRWKHPAFRFVQEIFEQFLIDHYSRSVTTTRCRRYRFNTIFAQRFSFMPVVEAADLLDTVSSDIHRLIQIGKLTPYEAQEPTYPLPLVKRSEVLAVGQEKGLFLSTAETAEKLGLPQNVVVDMAKIGLLKIESAPEIEHLLFSDTSINYCIGRLADHVIDAVLDPPKSPIDLTTAAKMLSEVGLNVADIFRCILDGNLKSYCYQLFPEDLGKLVFTKAHVRACIRRIRAKNKKYPDEIDSKLD